MSPLTFLLVGFLIFAVVFVAWRKVLMGPVIDAYDWIVERLA